MIAAAGIIEPGYHPINAITAQFGNEPMVRLRDCSVYLLALRSFPASGIFHQRSADRTGYLRDRVPVAGVVSHDARAASSNWRASEWGRNARPPRVCSGSFGLSRFRAASD